MKSSYNVEFNLDKYLKTAQEAETIVFKRGKTCYTLYYYTRPETAAANRPVHDAILAALRFA